jgi:hypothetical protein
MTVASNPPALLETRGRLLDGGFRPASFGFERSNAARLLEDRLVLLFLAAPSAASSCSEASTAWPAISGFSQGGALNSALARTQLGDAVLERTAVMKGAVQLHDWIGLRVVGFIVSPVAISAGRTAGWFYRPELHDGACIDLQNVTDQLQRLRALIDMAQASGLDLRVSLAPNKSTIYPDQLHPYFRGYWRCNAKDVAGVRERLKQYAPFVIDNAVHVARRTHHGIRTPRSYYLAEHALGHPYGGAIALRQLRG